MPEIILGNDGSAIEEPLSDEWADRRGQLVAALLLDDVLALMDASNAELDDLVNDDKLLASIPNSLHILQTVAFWKYMREQAVSADRPFVLPDVVRTNLHWKAPKIEDPLEGTYGIC